MRLLAVAPVVSVIRMPDGVAAPRVVKALAEKGYYVATGLPPHDQTLVRVGHMGDLTPAHMEGLLGALSESVVECDAEHSLRTRVP